MSLKGLIPPTVMTRAPKSDGERRCRARWQDAQVTSERIEVQRTIAADPAAIFRVLCDPQGHVAIDSSGMLMDATGEPVAAVGDSFVVHMDREALNDYPMGRYDVTVTITTFEPDREIAWTILGQIRPPIGHVYGYTLEPVDGGTLVTSYYDWSDHRPGMEGGRDLPGHPEGALRATLGILARTVARGCRRLADLNAFNLVASNGEVIATSESYESKASALKGVESVKRNAPDAVLKDQANN